MSIQDQTDTFHRRLAALKSRLWRQWRPQGWTQCCITLLLMTFSQVAGAHEMPGASNLALVAANHDAAFAVAAPAPMGAAKVALDPFTEITGWQLSNGWYFGKRSGEQSGLAFIWQSADDQLSVSTRGVRFIRRF